MDESEPSLPGAESAGEKPTRKTAVKRPRARTKKAASDSTGELPLSDTPTTSSEAKPKAARPRRPRKTAATASEPSVEPDAPKARAPRAKAVETTAAPETTSVPREEAQSAPKPEPSSEVRDARPSRGPREDSSSPPQSEPQENSRRDDQPRADAGAEASSDGEVEPRERNTFRPSRGGGADNGNGGNNAPDRGGSSDRGDSSSGGDEEREPWWKRKKDKKKKPKWERGGNGQGGKSRDGREPREKHPPQPLPPGMAPANLGSLPDAQRFNDLAALDVQASTAAASTVTPLHLDKLYALKLGELAEQGRALGVALDGVPSRQQWLDAIFKHAAEQNVPLLDRGWIDLTDAGYGFIVHDHVNYRLYPEDAYLPASLVKRYGLKRGHLVEVRVLPTAEGERCPAVIGINSVMGMPPENIAAVTAFEELEPYYPLQRILVEANEIHKDISMRSVDLLTPIGFGQRGLIVAPPRTGKTVLLQNMANSIAHNFPDVKLLLLLIDERPEEVTDFRRHTKGEVVSSTFDESPASHVHAAEMVIEKARRLVELGQHVVILLDSITRLARAYNALASNSGKIMSGGIEATALQKPKRFFGSARNIEGAGSLTILGTALIDTGSRMDEVIFEEFKGTGNMELHLDRGLSDKRIFPAINIDRSGTRKEELIYHPQEMQRVYGLRRAMQGLPPVEAMEMFITRLKKTKSNAEFLMSLNR